MRPNPIHNLLASGKPTLSTRVNICTPTIVEALAHTGVYDYVEFLAEYAPYDLTDLENFCRAAEIYNLGTMIKVDSDPRTYLAQRGIGAGFGSVLFADSRSVEDVRECVRIARPETPEDGGRFGVAMRRFTYMGYGGTPEYVQFLRDVVVAIMIEKREAVENLDEILAVPGIDLLQWGPADYSMSIGCAGERRDPRVTAAEKRVYTAAAAAGIPCRAEVRTVDDAKYYLDMGVRHFSLSADLHILFGWWKSNGEALRKELEQ
jgi:4-hydroxy-2-oxoheptanedioate aldolase